MAKYKKADIIKIKSSYILIVGGTTFEILNYVKNGNYLAKNIYNGETKEIGYHTFDLDVHETRKRKISNILK